MQNKRRQSSWDPNSVGWEWDSSKGRSYPIVVIKVNDQRTWLSFELMQRRRTSGESQDRRKEEDRLDGIVGSSLSVYGQE
ncbi:conserved hypothetical protein, partial [Trichinella spiralis]|uniref:hypothetical protein n=1 Tax=Trichinella spiralis TaxID=6334 RepID=UPI0001EFE112